MLILLGYVALFLVGWTVLGFLFTLLLWPRIAKRLDDDYPALDK